MHSTRSLTGLLIYLCTVVSVASLNQQALKTFGNPVKTKVLTTSVTFTKCFSDQRNLESYGFASVSKSTQLKRST